MTRAEPPRAGGREAIAARLAAVRSRIAQAALAAGRAQEPATLVAVSKGQEADALEAAIAAGQRLFGENRVQEGQRKWLPLKAAHPDIELHLVGPLQTNKVREAVALFDAIQTVDREKLARALAAEMARSGRRPACFVQVNTGEEPQKAGIAPADAAELVALCRDALMLPVTGLMCIPPAEDNPAPHFALLAKLGRALALPFLSMGMSGDYELAVRLGATHVRVGTAIFGERTA